MTTTVVVTLLALVIVAASAIVLGVRHNTLGRRLDVHRAFLEELFATSTEATVLLSASGDVLKVNMAFSDLFGYAEAEVKGRFIGDVLRSDAGPQHSELIRRVIDGEKIESKTVVQQKDGSPVPVSILGAHVHIPHEPITAFVIYRDATVQKQAEDAFRRMEKAVGTMQLGVTITDLGGTIVYTNPADASMHGYEVQELIGKDVRVFAPPGRTKLMSREQVESMRTWRRDSFNQRRDGSLFAVHLMSDVVRDAAGEIIGIVTTAEDITLRKRAERALKESEQRYALAIRGANDGLWDWNLETNEVYYSARWKSMSGYADAEIANTPEAWLGLVHEDDIGRVKSELAAHREDRSAHFESEHRIRQKDGTYRWVLARGIAERSPGGKPYRIAGSLTDIAERKGVEEQLAQDALYDPLTKLPNRTFITGLLSRSFRRTRRRKDYVFAVLFIDLDRFKVVNDSLGHAAGDQVLIEIASRIQQSLRPGDVVARLGGDEFCVLLDDIKDSSDTTRVAERIRVALDAPINLDGREVFTTASIGIAVSEPNLDSPEHLLRHADTAMYRAKARGKGRYEIFDRAMHQRAIALLQLETDIREAVANNQFRLVYLPVVNIVTQKISSFEALVRWEHPDRGLVPPGSFVPLAEETGLIVPLGWWILKEACAQMAKWANRFPGIPELSVSVNLSAKQLRQPDLVDRVTAALRDTDLKPERLQLEIAETVLMDEPDANIEVIHKLRELGVRVQIDDFGTGSSSLSYLNRFHVDSLKIDRSFINRVGVPGEKAAIVQAMITLARNLGIRVIAEGVETDQQSETLITFQCEQAQGYLFSEPLGPDQAGELLAEELSG